MEQVSYNLRLDLKDTGIVNTGFRLKQGDSGMKISVSIFNRGVNVFDSTTVPKIVFKRPDGASVMANMTVGSSVYEYVFVGNELQQPGVEIMDVKFTLPNDRRESTVSCSFVVVPDTITPNTHGSDIYDNDLAELVAEATAAAETVEEVVGDSEAWAVGERNGVPVGPEDPAYHNNSKYWSEQANVTSLAALTDVNLDNPADGDMLAYDSETEKWKNSSDVWDTMAQNGAHNYCNYTLNKANVGTVTYTENADRSITLNGTPTGDSSVNLYNFNIPKQKYILSGIGDAVNVRFGALGLYKGATQVKLWIISSTEDFEFDTSAYDYDEVNIYMTKIETNVACSGTVYPMIRLASDPNTDYTPYVKTNRDLTVELGTELYSHTVQSSETFRTVLNDLWNNCINSFKGDKSRLKLIWRRTSLGLDYQCPVKIKGGTYLTFGIFGVSSSSESFYQQYQVMASGSSFLTMTFNTNNTIASYDNSTNNANVGDKFIIAYQ